MQACDARFQIDDLLGFFGEALLGGAGEGQQFLYVLAVTGHQLLRGRIGARVERRVGQP